MKNLLILVLIAFLAFCQTSWGNQNEPEDLVGGLFDIVFDVVTAPCSLLAVCLGIDPGCNVCDQRPTPRCAPSKPYYHCPCCGRPMKAIATHWVPVARSAPLSRKHESTKSVGPLIPVKKSGYETSVPAAARSFPEPLRFVEPKAQTSPPVAPEISRTTSDTGGIIAVTPEPAAQRAEVEKPPQKLEIRPKLPDAIPLAPDNLAEPFKENIKDAPKRVDSERKEPVINMQTTPSPAAEIIPDKAAKKSKDSLQEATKKPSKERKRPCGPVYPPACGPRLWYR